MNQAQETVAPPVETITQEALPNSHNNSHAYQDEYTVNFVDRWDTLIDWDARAKSEGSFFSDILNKNNTQTVLDVSTGTGFNSVQLLEAGFNVTSVDGSARMLAKAFENAKNRNHILKTIQADWRWLGKNIHERFDAIICLGNSFTHLQNEMDRRRVLAEFYAALKPDGIMIIDQRNYDFLLDNGYKTKHKYYYCGNKVSVEPIKIQDNLVRFQYSFPGGAAHTLDLFPLRRHYFCQLLEEAGFASIDTYGDFEENYQEDETDFFIHVVKKL